MKKTFVVDVIYEELPENVEKNADVFYDTALEVAVENLMESYKVNKSIKDEYVVIVRKI
jgi:hypothetical protein